MKKIIYYLTGLFIVGGMATSCKDIDSTFKEFVVPGGLVYPEKAVNPVIHSGRNRVEIYWLKGVDPSVTKARIFWNNYTDSVEVVIPASGDTIRTFIDNLEENNYSFYIRTYDEKGNSSIPVELLGDVYGDKYQSDLLDRPVVWSLMNSDGLLSIKWGRGSDGAYATDVKYIDPNGATVIQRIGINDTEDTILLNNAATTYQCRTWYRPDPACIDTFYANFVENKISMKIDRSNWIAAADLFKPTTGTPNMAIDNDITTCWESYPTATKFPHWLSVDMRNPMNVSYVELVNQQDNTKQFLSFTVEGSLDGETWTPYGAYTFGSTNSPQLFSLISTPYIQYIRIYATTGGSKNMLLAEINAWGYKTN